MRPNVLLITLDQYRGDSLSCAGHPLVRTPHLDALAADGVRFSRHYAQAAPCAPGRAALYTGTYQMNNRVVANGTPLDFRLDNVARAGLRAGYHPVMFGYTDQGADPRRITDSTDPRLTNWEGVLPGFEELLCLDERHEPWMEWLRALGYDADDPDVALATEHERLAEHSVTQFLTDRFLAARRTGRSVVRTHVVIRPHPPYDAAGHYSTMYSPADCPPPLPVPAERHPVHDVLLKIHWTAGPTETDDVAQLQSQYFGMISEVDHHMGRIWQALQDRGDWDNTVIIVTADHGEQLCDQGLVQKAGFYESSYHIIGMIRDPRHPEGFGNVVTDFTENVDIMPTLCEAIGEPVPLQCDGLPLTPFLRASVPRVGERRRTTSGTGATCSSRWRAMHGRGTESWSGRIWPSYAPTGTPTCSSATATGCASIWRPTPHGRRRSPTPQWCCRSPSRCWCGASSTSIASSPARSSRRADLLVARPIR